jgi:lipopolysaccharide heptosyltransferase II
LIDIDPRRIGRILIRANNWIGDVVMISPAVRAIRGRFPDARIAILAKRWVLETLHGNPFFDDLIEHDDGDGYRKLTGSFRLAADLRRRRFDLAVLFQKAFEAAALAFLGHVRIRVGYATDYRSALLTHPLPPPSASMHHIDAFLGLARALGCRVDDPVPFFHLDGATRDQAGGLLPATWKDGAPIVALHPGASKPGRAWHAQRFAGLAALLCRDGGARLLVLGGPGEQELVTTIASAVPADRVLAPTPSPSIRVTAALMERCRLFVGNDSGPMHLAAAVGVPTIGLFGPGDPRKTAPRGRAGVRITTISKSYPCSPCRQDFFRECPPSPSDKPFCLEEIDVAEVGAAALALLRPAG